jgi:hypothetical protein
MIDEMILVELWNNDDDAFAATASTIRLLGGELSRPERGEHEGLCVVRPVSRDPAFLRWAMAQQGYVKRVVR